MLICIYTYIQESDLMRCSLRPSQHTKERTILRGIDKEEILEAIEKGPKRFYENKIIVSYKGFEVVYRQYPCNYFIITLYWKE